MDPDEPITPWFDDVFEQMGRERSASLRRRHAAARSGIASVVEAAHPGAPLTPRLFVRMVPTLVGPDLVPTSVTAARSYLSVVSRVLDVATPDADEAERDIAVRAVRGARQQVEQAASERPDDSWGRRIPRRLLQRPFT